MKSKLFLVVVMIVVLGALLVPVAPLAVVHGGLTGPGWHNVYADDHPTPTPTPSGSSCGGAGGCGGG